jgi:hypothetical protein
LYHSNLLLEQQTQQTLVLVLPILVLATVLVEARMLVLVKAVTAVQALSLFVI